MRQEVTHRWGVTASGLKRSSLSTGGWVGRKLTSPAPIYDIALYLIKGSESALNSSLISERYRKEIVRERAREILCRSVEVRRGKRVLKELCLAKETGALPRRVTPLPAGSSHLSHSTGQAHKPYRVGSWGTGVNFGTCGWKPERIESSIPTKSWLTSRQAWIWVLDFKPHHVG